MLSIETLKKPIRLELETFKKYFKQYIKTNIPLLNAIIRFIIYTKGIQIRPILVFLTYKAFNPITQDKAYMAASLLEILHTATLVHDDVVDDSMYRRHFFSINALWKNKIAVLTGDFLLAKSLLLCVDNKEYKMLFYMSEAVRKMSEGELLQIEKARSLDITEEIYLEIIKQKTAVLFATCCACGALASQAKDNEIQLMYEFGELIGIVFQIKDDLLDYTRSNIIGKPAGLDIRDRKITLPLLYTLLNCSLEEKKWIKNTLRKSNKSTKELKKIISLVQDKGGIEYTNKKMKEYSQEALKKLEFLEESEYKKTLQDLVIFVEKRKK